MAGKTTSLAKVIKLELKLFYAGAVLEENIWRGKYKKLTTFF